jgi:protein TonB
MSSSPASSLPHRPADPTAEPDPFPRRVVRYSASVAVGAVVTMGVLFLMQGLIATANRKLNESGTRHFVDFVRVERQAEVQRKERKRERPQTPDAPPPDAPQPRVDAYEASDAGLSLAAPVLDASVQVEGLGLEASDGEYLPIVKIAPVYPWNAQAEGIHGTCLVEYTVTTTGSVKDVRVIEGNPPKVFDQASTEAALKFKYKPRIVNGEPIEVHGVRNLFTYKLDG